MTNTLMIEAEGLTKHYGDTIALAEAVRDLAGDMIVVAIGRDPSALALACADVITLADGILVSPPSTPAWLANESHPTTAVH